MAKKRKPKSKLANVEHTISYLSQPRKPKTVRAVIREAPDAVIRAICNAALNAREGDVHVPPHLKHLFREHRNHVNYLCSHDHPIEKKRHLIQSGGALPIVVPLLATVLGSIGGEFISRLFNKNE